jgi:hypothetical protein
MRQAAVAPMAAGFLALLGLGSSACGSGGDGASSSALGTCGLRADVSGGAVIRFAGKDDAACVTQHSSGSGLDLMFIGAGAKGTLELSIDDVTEGETGRDFPARVVVTSQSKQHWQGSACLAAVSEHDLFSTEVSELGELRHYRVSGEGDCSDTLDSVPAGAEAATLGPFAFRAEVTWRD